MSRSTALLATALTVLLGTTGFAALGSAKEAALSSAPLWTEGDSAPAPGRPDSFADLADRLSAAVVFIEVERPAPQQNMFGPHELPFPFRTPEEGEPQKEQPQRRPRTAPASGSGFVISPDGFIV